jgi:glycosyltransferase involved in cell wall biosynthesis
VTGAAARSITHTLLAQRLREAARILIPGGGDRPAEPAPLLALLLASVTEDSGNGRLWLLVSAATGAYPVPDALDALRRRLELASPDDRVAVFLAETVRDAADRGDWNRPLRIVEGGTFVDVNFCAKYVHNTGIQRVVRRMVPELLAVADEHPDAAPIELLAWTRESGITRTLSPVERDRVVAWDTHDRRARSSDTGDGEIVIPWRSRVLLPEVAEPELIDRLAGFAEYSGNWIGVVAHDLIPVSSAQFVDARESDRTAHYLRIVKHADAVFTVSESVAGEFRGFVTALGAQGITGPSIQAIPLAMGSAGPGETHEPAAGSALVLCVGSHEPRKNQEALLFAAEVLQRQGLAFRMVFVGGGSRRNTLSFDQRVRRLRDRDGLNIESMRGVGDAELWQLYHTARFTALLSLHEGFGLPVVESLAHGTPVLTSDFGSMAEIAAAGGCVTVDPRDDDAIVETMRRMLTDDALIERLRGEIAGIPSRTWHDYSTELWNAARLGVAV